MGSPIKKTYTQNARFKSGKFDVLCTKSEWGKALFTSITIILKVQLVQHEKVKGIINDGIKDINVGSWPKEDWLHFNDVYQKEGQKFWDDRFTLESDAKHQFSSVELDAKEEINEFERQEYYFNEDKFLIDCRFQLKLVNSAADAHKIIKVVYLTEDKYFRSTDSEYSSRDINEVRRKVMVGDTKVIIKQKTFIHEIGHAIGLEHVGVYAGIPECIKHVDHNVAACYGEGLLTRSNIMGGGSTLSLNEARPWLSIAHDMYKQHTWKIYKFVPSK